MTTTAQPKDPKRDTVAAVGVHVDRTVRPLAEQLERLQAAYSEDYPGHELSAGLMQRVRWWCADKATPSVSAGPDGAICATWGEGPLTLAVRLAPDGAAHWAGLKNFKRTYGKGYPSTDDWPCLRPNAELTGRLRSG